MSFNKLLSASEDGNAVDIVTVIDSMPDHGQIGQMLIVCADGRTDSQLNENSTHRVLAKMRTISWVKPVTISIEDGAGGTYRLFWDRIVSKKRAIVLGGGHISQPLVQMLALLAFDVTVVDDRPEFANSLRFPGAQRILCENFQQALRQLTIDDSTAVIIVTRGHRYDMDCLWATMAANARYLGMIGSRRRIREVIGVLREEGAPAELEIRLSAPIGLDIQAETPAEIAVSIAAEVVLAFRGGTGRPLRGHKGEA